MHKVWFKVLQLGAAATLMTASAAATTRSIPSSAISTYQDFNCFDKDIGGVRLSTSTSCRNKGLAAWLPVGISSTSTTFSAEITRFRTNSTSCDESFACVIAYALDKEGDVTSFTEECGAGGWRDVATDTLPVSSMGSAGIVLHARGQSGCSVAFGAVRYTF